MKTKILPVNPSVRMAPFETFAEHDERARSEAPYNEAFINRCRAKALEYDQLDQILRAGLLQELEQCIPLHYRAKVFDGIRSFGRV